MEELSLTYWLALGHLTLYGTAFRLTRYPVVTVFHLLLATQVIAFVLRPVLAALKGGYTIYPVEASLEAYNLGLLYQLVFALFYVTGYLAVRKGRPKVIPGILPDVLRGYLVSLSIGVVAVGLIHVLSQGAWLPTARSATLTSVVPLGKILFPLAVIPLSLSLPLAYLAYRRRPRLWPILGLGVSVAFILLSLLYQRGFVIYGLILIVFLYERLKGLGYLKAGFAALLAIFLLAFLRPLASVIAGGESLERGFFTRIESFVLGPSFDNADVWPIAIAYVQDKEVLLGETFLTIPARFLSPSLRQQLGLTTAGDKLNEFYWGDAYWRNNFGFNVTLPQELLLNFGGWLLILGFVPGLLTWLVDRWLQQRQRLTVTGMYVMGAIFFTGGFVGEIGGIVQWGLAFILVGWLIGTVARVRIFQGKHAASLPHHPH